MRSSLNRLLFIIPSTNKSSSVGGLDRNDRIKSMGVLVNENSNPTVDIVSSSLYETKFRSLLS